MFNQQQQNQLLASILNQSPRPNVLIPKPIQQIPNLSLNTMACPIPWNKNNSIPTLSPQLSWLASYQQLQTSLYLQFFNDILHNSQNTPQILQRPTPNQAINKDLQTSNVGNLAKAKEGTRIERKISEKLIKPTGIRKGLRSVSFSTSVSSGLEKLPESKKIKKRNLCVHQDKKHYAKNLCYKCYHQAHDTRKKPWKCEHDTLYAKGICQKCYIMQYCKKRKRVGGKKRKAILKGRKAYQTKLLKQGWMGDNQMLINLKDLLEKSNNQDVVSSKKKNA
jgi:hypothetical protein